MRAYRVGSPSRPRRRRSQSWRARAFYPLLGEQLECRRLLDGAADSVGAVSAAWFEPAPAANSPAKEHFLGPLPAWAIGPPAVPDSAGWIVQLTSAATRQAGSVPGLADLLNNASLTLEVVRGLGLPGMALVRTNRDEAATRQMLASHPFVEYFERDESVSIQRNANDPRFLAGDMPGLHNTGQFGGTVDADIKARSAWDETIGSPSVVVGVIDSGIDPAHPDLYLNVWLNQGEIPPGLKSQLLTAGGDINGDGRLTFYDLNNCAVGVGGVHNPASCNWALGPSAPFLSDFAPRDGTANGYIDALDLLEDPRWSDGVDTDGNGFIDDLFGWNFRSEPDEPFAPNNPGDVLGHGTHVAGTIGAIGNNALGVTGVNWQTSLMALKFLDSTNQGKTSDAIRALNYVTMMKTKYGVNVPVTNNSWGQAGGFSPSLEAAIRSAGEAEILFVAAAGNGNVLGRGVDNDRTPFYPAGYNLDNIIAVAASDASDQLAQFSNFGATSVDVAAPGVGIISTLPGGRYGTANGTSMAAPHVSGTAALVWSALPASTMAEVRSAIFAGVDKVSGLEARLSQKGRLDAAHTLSTDVFAPNAQLVTAADVTAAGGTSHLITVQYSYRNGINLATIADGDLLVTRRWGPQESFSTRLVPGSVQSSDGGKTVAATYEMTPPGGSWDALDYGSYEVSVVSGAVSAATGTRSVHGRELGRFQVRIAANGIFYVNSFSDAADASFGDGNCADGASNCTLRAAVQEANALSITPQVSTATGLPLAIPDGAKSTSQLVVSGVSGALSDVDVQLSITHTSVADLSVFLVSPTGTRVELFSGVGGSGDNFTNTLFDDGASVAIAAGTAPFTGSFRPAGLLSAFSGQDANGTWLLEITDGTPANAGSVVGWSLRLSSGGGSGTTNTSSTDIPKTINDLATLTSTLAISNLGAITDVNVTLNISHTWNEDLDVFLISPVGTRVELFTDVGGSSENFTGTILDDQATQSITAGTAPFSNRYRPEGSLAALNGESPNGTWKLEISDDVGGDTGTLNSWSLEITAPTSSLVTRDSTDVPKPIPDAITLLAPLHVVGFSGTLSDVNVRVDITHAADSELAAFLNGPGGTRVELFRAVGGSGDNFQGTILDDEAATPIAGGAAPFTGAFRPSQPLSVFDGLNPNGTWTLELVDQSTGNAGTLNSWSLEMIGQAIIVLDSGQFNLSIPPIADPGVSFPLPAVDSGCTNFSQSTTWSNGTTGDLDIIGNVLIVGNQSTETTIDAGGVDRVFRVYPGASLSLQRLTISGGSVAAGQGGGGILSAGDLKLDLATVTENFASGLPNLIGGGGIAVWGGHTTVHRSTLSNNAADMGGGLFVCRGGKAAITASTISHNVARAGVQQGAFAADLPGGGAIASLHGGQVLVENSTLSSNSAVNLPGTAVFQQGHAALLANRESDNPSLSSDGRYIAFESWASNLAFSDGNSWPDIFVYDRQREVIEQVSVPTNAPANAPSFSPAISGNGRFVAFASDASNLISSDTNAATDVFVVDRSTGSLERVSVSSAGVQGQFASHSPSISDDGRFVAFTSNSPNLVAGDTNNVADVFVFDRQERTIERVSVANNGSQVDGASDSASISSDGRWVAFSSSATNLITGDTNGRDDIFVFDRQTRMVERVSVTSSGLQVTADSYEPAISGNGRFVAFESDASTLVTGDTNGVRDIFVFDRQAPTVMERVSLATGGGQATAASFAAAISHDGRYVTFESSADALASGDSNGASDVYVFDRQMNSVARLSSVAGVAGNSGSENGRISSDGKVVAFLSDATNLVNGDTNGMRDLFLVERVAGTVEGVTVRSSSGEKISLDHVTIALHSGQSDTQGYVSSHSSLYAGTTLVPLGPGGEDLSFNIRASGDTLGPLEFAGGPTRVHLLLANNPAFDLGDPNDFPSADQRGVERPKRGADFVVLPDAGAVEMSEGIVTGVIYLDRDGDSKRSSDERGIAGVTVFLDENLNQEWEPHEPRTVTTDDDPLTAASELGRFLFANVATGIHHVVVMPPDNWSATDENQWGLVRKSFDAGAQRLPALSYDGKFVAFLSDVPVDPFGIPAPVPAPQVTLSVLDRERLVYLQREFVQTVQPDPFSPPQTAAVKYYSDSAPAIGGNGLETAFSYSVVIGQLPFLTILNLADVVDLTLPASHQVGSTVPFVNDSALAISSDSRMVAFDSSSDNLVAGDGNGVRDVFVADRQTNTLEVVSRLANGTTGDGASQKPSLSGSGQFVAFQSAATNLVTNDTGGFVDIFVFDRQANTIERVSEDINGVAANAASANASISGDGRFVAFESAATNLVTGDFNGATNVFVHDRWTGAVQLMSRATSGGPGNAASSRPAISADGRFVVFESDASNLVPGDNNGVKDVFVADRWSGQVVRVSVAPTGNELPVASENATISGDGREIAFEFDTEIVARYNPLRSAATRTAFAYAGQTSTSIALGLSPDLGEIRGSIFEDLVANGSRETGEPPLVGWTAYLDLTANGRLDDGEPKATSDANGQYVFASVASHANYRVGVVAPSGWEQVLPRIEDGGHWHLFLNAGDVATERDFGFVRKSTGGQFENATVQGVLYQDSNGSKDRQAGEPGLAGITVFLDLNDDGIRQFDEPRTVTRHDDPATPGVDETGQYTFPSLGNRDYTVRAIITSLSQQQTAPLGNELTRFTTSFTSSASALSNPQDVVIADFTGDGVPDVATVLFDRNVVSILPGTGTGEMLAPIDVSLAPEGTGPVALLTGNWNGMGSPDLAVVNAFSESVTILLDFNTTTKTFASKSRISVGKLPRSLAAGDFDKDGDQDLVVANEKSNSLTILRNDGAGTFEADTADIAVGNNPFSVAALQLTDDNADGVTDANDRVDLVVANFGQFPSGANLGSVSVFFANGSGGFTPQGNYNAGHGPAAVAGGDLNGDGFTDVVVANFLANTVSLLINNQQGGFPVQAADRPGDLSAGTGPADIEVVDMDADNDMDLVVINRNSKDISLFRNLRSQTGATAFEPGESYGLANFPAPVQLTIASGDVNRDGLVDLAVTNGTDNNIAVLVNRLVGGAHRVALTGVETVTGLSFGIQPVNLPPTLDPISPPPPVNEDSGEVVISLTGISPGPGESQPLEFSVQWDNPGLIVGYTVQHTPGSSTGSVRLQLGEDRFGQTVVTVTVTDAGLDNNPNTAGDNGSVLKTFPLTVVAVNDPPSVSLTGVVPAVDENTVLASRLRVATVQIQDDGLGGQAISLGGADANRFEVVGGELFLSAGVTLDFETRQQFVVIVAVDDPSVGTTPDDAATLTLNITNINEPPVVTVTPTNTSLPEDTSTTNRRKVADVSVADDALGSVTLTLAEPQAAVFELQGSELFLRAGTVLDFENQSQFVVVVRANDPAIGGDPDSTATLTLAITDVNEPPALLLVNPTLSLLENSSTVSRRRIADILVFDDALGGRILSLAGANADRFELAGSQLFLRAGGTLDFETQFSLVVIVQVDDPSLGTDVEDQEILTLNISDVNEPPSLILANTVSSLAENTDFSVRHKIANMIVVDDALGTAALSLAGQHASMFEISGSELFLRAGSSLNFESTSQLFVTVQVDDPSLVGNPDGTAAWTIQVVDENEPPSIQLANVTTSLPENSSTSSRRRVADVIILDDALGGRTVSLAGADASRFELSGNGLFLRAGVTLDFEAQATLLVVAEVDDPVIGSGADSAATLTLQLTDVNEPPAVQLANIVSHLAEKSDMTSARKVADIVVSDDALGVAQLSLTGADASVFEIQGQSLFLRAGTVLDSESRPQFAVIVAVDDPVIGAGPEGTATLTVTITDVNDPPSVTLANVATSLAENSSTSSRRKVADIVVADDAIGSRVLLLAGPDANRFEILGSELYLRAAVPLDFEQQASFVVLVQVDDPGIGVDVESTATMTLGVTDVNEPPTISLSNPVASLLETDALTAPVKVGDVVVSDDALGSATLRLSGPDSSSFELQGNQLFVRAGTVLDFETLAQLRVTVEVDDPSVGSDPDNVVAWTVNVTDANEPPQELLLSNIRINEMTDTSGGAVAIGRFVVIDEDRSGSYSFSLVAGLGANDNSQFEITNQWLSLKQGVSLSFANRPIFSVRVDLTDGAFHLEQVFEILVTDFNSAPTGISLLPAAVAENVDTSTMPLTLGVLLAADDNPASQHQFSFAVGTGDMDNSRFQIDGNSLAIRKGESVDFEQQSQYAVRIAVFDGVNRLEQALSINVLDINEPPQLSLANTVTNLAEDLDTSARRKVADIVLVDDALGQEAVQLTGPDAGRFELAGSELFLRAGAALDFETAGQFVVIVQVDDAALGSGPEAATTLTLTISDVNEPPSVSLANAVLELSENTDLSSRLKVADVVITDDALGDEQISLTGPDAGAFEIVGNALFLRAGSALDFESSNQFLVVVRVDDVTLGSVPESAATLTLNITDVNEPPTVLLANAVVELPENTEVASRLKIADVAITDDALGDEQISLTGPDATAFEVVGNTLFLLAGATLDFESSSQFLVVVQVDDVALGSGPEAATTLTLAISDVNEPPELALANTTPNLPEDTDVSVRRKIAELVITDDALGQVLVGLSGPNAQQFELQGHDLFLKAGTSLDFETGSQYVVVIEVNDADLGTGAEATATVTVTATDVNEPPDISLTDVVQSLPEDLDVTSRHRVANLAVSDDALGETIIVLSGADRELFEVEASALFLKAGAALNAATNASLEIIVSLDDPTLGDGPESSAGLTIQVIDTNHAPTTQDEVAETDEDTAVSVPLTLVDEDGDALTVIVSDDDNRLGKVTVVSDQLGTRIVYDPSQSETLQALRNGAFREEEITFQVDDGRGGQAAGKVTVRVHGRNDWHNPALPADVNRNGSVEPQDALLILNTLLAQGSRSLLPVVGIPTLFYDTNNDNFVAPLDVLAVVNVLQAASREGESPEWAFDSVLVPTATISNELLSDWSRTTNRVDSFGHRNERPSAAPRPDEHYRCGPNLGPPSSRGEDFYAPGVRLPAQEVDCLLGDVEDLLAIDP